MVARGCGLVEVNVAPEMFSCEKKRQKKGNRQPRISQKNRDRFEMNHDRLAMHSGCTCFVLASKNVLNHTKAEPRTLQCGRKA